MSTARSSLQAETLHANNADDSSEKKSDSNLKSGSEKQVENQDLTTENQMVDVNGANPKPKTDVYGVDDEKYIAGMDKFHKLTWKQLTIV